MERDACGTGNPDIAVDLNAHDTVSGHTNPTVKGQPFLEPVECVWCGPGVVCRQVCSV